jgi:hypothetical protein
VTVSSPSWQDLTTAEACPACLLPVVDHREFCEWCGALLVSSAPGGSHVASPAPAARADRARLYPLASEPLSPAAQLQTHLLAGTTRAFVPLAPAAALEAGRPGTAPAEQALTRAVTALPTAAPDLPARLITPSAPVAPEAPVPVTTPITAPAGPADAPAGPAPSAPAAPAVPIAPTGPIAPAGPIAPTGPTVPSGATVPSGPAAPAVPVAFTGPAEPAHLLPATTPAPVPVPVPVPTQPAIGPRTPLETATGRPALPQLPDPGTAPARPTLPPAAAPTAPGAPAAPVVAAPGTPPAGPAAPVAPDALVGPAPGPGAGAVGGPVGGPGTVGLRLAATVLAHLEDGLLAPGPATAGPQPSPAGPVSPAGPAHPVSAPTGPLRQALLSAYAENNPGDNPIATPMRIPDPLLPLLPHPKPATTSLTTPHVPEVPFTSRLWPTKPTPMANP